MQSVMLLNGASGGQILARGSVGGGIPTKLEGRLFWLVLKRIGGWMVKALSLWLKNMPVGGVTHLLVCRLKSSLFKHLTQAVPSEKGRAGGHLTTLRVWLSASIALVYYPGFIDP